METVKTTHLLEANPSINPYNLYVGQKVNVPVGENIHVYTVQAGDTFWIISQKLNISLTSLLAANPNGNPNNLYPELTLNLPSNASTDSSSTPSVQTYTIQAGDTFWILSQKFNVDVAHLIASNPTINPNNLYVGLKVNIPSPTVIPQTNVTVPSYLANGMFPLKKGTYRPFVNSYGDERTYNPDGTLARQHEGIDIMAPKGSPIYSVYDGVVSNKGWSTLGGWRLTVKTPDGKTAFYYAHMSGYAANILVGSKIAKGQVIGYVGNTGYGTTETSGLFESHLYLGMYDVANGFAAMNPYNHLKYWESISN